MLTCDRPDCTGGQIEDGYCVECGRPPLAASGTGGGPGNPAAGGGVPGGTGGTGPAGSTGSAGNSGGTSGIGGTSSGLSAGRTSSGRGSRRAGVVTGRRLGVGIVDVPAVPRRDPEEALATDPVVPEDKRVCRKCDQPVGRGRGGRPGVANGFCPRDRTPFSFAPKLQRGDMVDRYRVVGCLARGGFGWVYLAQDTQAHDMWVVLKGLLGSDDEDSRLAALAEQKVLTRLKHANIVHIQTVVTRGDPHTGSAETYLVMEYVGGLSLKDLLKRHRAAEGPKAVLPVEQVLAYAIEILPAFGYLHQQNLVYCDFKPDNVIQTEDQLKLIDLGAVRDMDNQGGAIYGTVGYQAPEIEREGPSVESDLFTVGRTMAVLSFPFAGFTRKWKADLPPASEVPLFREFESYHRLLLRATHRDPLQRFASAAEMADQCTGVLREIVAARTGEPQPAPSQMFGPETRVASPEVAARSGAGGASAPPPDTADMAAALPLPRVDATDPAAGLLATLTTTDPTELLAALRAAGVVTPQGSLRLAQLSIGNREFERARRFLDDIDSDDWRLPWFLGLAALSEGALQDAHTHFDRVRGALPGEIAPRLALGVCRELLGRHREAAAEYAGVWRTNSSYVSAAFGLARCLLATGDRVAAVRTLESVPDTSSHHLAAQTAALRTRVGGRKATEPLGPDLVTAAARLQALALESEAHDRHAAELLGAALDWVLAGSPGGATAEGGGAARVLGSELREKPLRFALEKCYRALARHATTRPERVALVDKANEVRPWTWV